MQDDAFRLNARLLSRFDITPDLAIFRIARDHGWFDYRPGQYTVIGLPAVAPRCSGTDEADPNENNGNSGGADRLIRRAYSIASSSAEDGSYLELYITLVHSGRLTPRLWCLNPGDPLWVGPKATGHFTLDQVPPTANLILVATGTGLAPYISMIRSEHACNVGRRFVVVHGARYSWDLGYRNMLQRLAAECPESFVYLPTVTRRDLDPTWGGHVGRVQSVFEDGALEKALGAPLSPEVFQVFLCGNPEMVLSLQAMLEARGYRLSAPKKPGTLHIEKYW